MKILTIDTALNSMYITLSEDSTILVSKIVENTKEKYHSAFIIPTIIDILTANNMTMKEVEAIGVNVGPGSFTGIRAGLTVAKVAAQELDIPVVSVSSLQILSLINKTEKQSLCLLDARKNKAYIGIFNPDGSIVQEPCALEYEKTIELINDNDFYVISDDRMADIIEEKGITCHRFLQGNYDLGTNLAKLTSSALIDKMSKQIFTGHTLKPLYIQPPPISMPKAKSNIK